MDEDTDNKIQLEENSRFVEGKRSRLDCGPRDFEPAMLLTENNPLEVYHQRQLKVEQQLLQE
jgi:hypothetical protein